MINRLLTIFTLCYIALWSATASEPRAGSRVSKQAIETIGLDSYFKVYEINDDIFQRIDGLSYRDGCTLPLSQLRYLKVLHINAEGEVLIGELICNVEIAGDLIAIFRELYDKKYPIERMVLVDEYEADDNLSMASNNSSGFNYRYIAGTTRLSNHSYGMAVDINPLYNPYVRSVNGREVIEPEGSAKYADREVEHPYMVKRGDACHEAFTSRGFTWGGAWRSVKDYQHFEMKR